LAESPELKPDPGQSASANAQPGRKFGEGHMAGMLRLGLKELAQILPAFPDSNIKPVEEPGVVGNVTPQIATDQMGYDTPLDSSHRGKFQNQEQERSR
jgi:hypothetical protein